MPKYRVSGNDRAEGSLGVASPFTVTVIAADPLEAIEKARRIRYSLFRSHVHIVAPGQVQGCVNVACGVVELKDGEQPWPY